MLIIVLSYEKGTIAIRERIEIRLRCLLYESRAIVRRSGERGGGAKRLGKFKAYGYSCTDCASLGPSSWRKR